MIINYSGKQYLYVSLKKNGSKNKKIKLVEGGKVLTEDTKIAETFNSFFGNIVNTLNIEKDESIFCDTGDETDPLLRAIKKFSKPPSILRIRQYFKNPTEFSFVPVDKDVIAKEIKNLNTKKAAPQDDIPVKILKLNNDIFSQYLSQIFNESIEAANFPNELKYAYITPVYKKIIDMKKKIIDLLVLYLLYPNHSNVVFMIKSIKTLTIHCLDIRWATERDIALNIH